MTYSSLAHDLYQFGYPSVECPLFAVCITGLVFTVTITKKYDARLKIFGMKTVNFGGLVLSETTVTRSQEAWTEHNCPGDGRVQLARWRPRGPGLALVMREY